MGDNAKIYAFEPSLQTFNTLLSNTTTIKNLEKFNFGFSDTNQNLTLYFDNPNSGMASVYKRNLEYSCFNQSEEIKVMTIDEFSEEMGIQEIDFLKLDVEGHEYRVLLGAKDLINNDKIKHIQFEFGGCNIDSRTYFRDFYYLLHPKYELFRILRDGVLRIDQYRETLEIFTTTNFLAIHR